jgi:flavin reductase (DIM6/NTAB) family NADH-FMN oxidoreductase RutF
MPRSADLRLAVDQLAVGSYIMTAAFESKRAGVLITSIQKCAEQPLLVCVSTRKGHVIEPLIRDSHRFAVCRLDGADRLTVRRFEHPPIPGERYDPFDSLEIDHLAGHAPILRRSPLALECEVFRHFDLEADHELYIGIVLAARVAGAPVLSRRGVEARADGTGETLPR